MIVGGFLGHNLPGTNLLHDRPFLAGTWLAGGMWRPAQTLLPWIPIARARVAEEAYVKTPERFPQSSFADIVA